MPHDDSISIPDQFDAIGTWVYRLVGTTHWTEDEFDEAREICAAISELRSRIDAEGPDVFRDEMDGSNELYESVDHLVADRPCRSMAAAMAKLRFDINSNPQSSGEAELQTVLALAVAEIERDPAEAVRLLRIAVEHPTINYYDATFPIRLQDVLRQVEGKPEEFDHLFFLDLSGLLATHR